MPGPHGFAVRFSAVRLRASIAHEPKLALPSDSRDDAAASTASPPNVRDDRDTPLSWAGMARNKELICV